MSRFLHSKLQALAPYTPGEQPRDRQYCKLNTNESPYPPPPAVAEALDAAEAGRLRLYSDPESRELKAALAAQYGLQSEQVFVSNGSDDILSFAFWCFGERGALFPEVTYSFYPVFARLHGVAYRTVPLRADWSIDPKGLCDSGALILLANPNAPTGLALPRAEIAEILAHNRDTVVVVDEAYVDFGAESAVPLLAEHENLLVVMTFSKSRSMAGARLGFALGSAELIADLERVKYATNPYNVNRLTTAAALAALREQAYFDEKAREIQRTREETRNALLALGFQIPPSQANFLWVRHPAVAGETLYRKCRERGVLIRHFSDAALRAHNRVTIGTPEEMARFLRAAAEIIQEETANA